MGFAAPIYLLLLVPWTAALVWVLLGRTRFAHVSSLQFWEATEVASAPRRAVRRPPLPIVLMLLAALLAILAAAGLGYRTAQADRLTLIIDRGLLTSTAIAKDVDAVWRQILAKTPSIRPVDLLLVPGDTIRQADVSDVHADLANLRPSSVDTSDWLPQVVRRELARTGQEVLVVTAHPVKDADPRVHVLRPSPTVTNAGIERFAVTEGVHPQAMVRIFNSTDLSRATLRVSGVEQAIDLPPVGEPRDYFVDLPPLDAIVAAELVVTDDIAADNVAYLAQRQAWPRLNAVSLPPPLLRLIDVYTRQRPPVATSRRVVVADAAQPLAADVAGAIVATPGIGAKLRFASVSADRSHPICRDVAWQRVAKDATLQLPKGNGWKTIVRADDQPLVAIREQPVRQVWVAVDSPAWATELDFVVFWTNVFDWLGGGTATYTSEPAGEVPPAWKRVAPLEALPVDAAPGVFEAADGLHARSVVAVRPTTAPASAAAEQLTSTSRVMQSLATPLLLAALALLLAGVWQGHRLTPF